MVWWLHVQQFEYLRESEPTNVRQFLIESGDVDRQRDWDAGKFKDTMGDGSGA